MRFSGLEALVCLGTIGLESRSSLKFPPKSGKLKKKPAKQDTGSSTESPGLI